MFNVLKREKYWYLTIFLLCLVTFFVYSITSEGATPYNYFIRLADAFLHGRYYLQDNPSWLNELIPLSEQKFAIVYPPAPAVVSIPFVLIFGLELRQEIISQIMGTVAAFVWGLIAFQKTGKKLSSLWMFLFASFGNIVWFMSSNGSVWYMGQVSAFMFITLVFYESINKKRPFFIGLYFSLAFLSRLQLFLAFPAILYFNRYILQNFKKTFSLVFVPIISVVLMGLYNYIRFGSFIETGYSLIPGVLEEPWYSRGIFDISYIPSNLKVMFTSMPIIKDVFPYITPSWGGLAIWITSPVFFYCLTADFKKTANIVAIICLVSIAFIIFTHGGTGFTQFGYRYAVDFYPFMFLLILDSLEKQKLKWHHWLLLNISILVNFWGVLWINKFGWVSF